MFGLSLGRGMQLPGTMPVQSELPLPNFGTETIASKASAKYNFVELSIDSPNTAPHRLVSLSKDCVMAEVRILPVE